jgi:hypothetical protein
MDLVIGVYIHRPGNLDEEEGAMMQLVVADPVHLPREGEAVEFSLMWEDDDEIMCRDEGWNEPCVEALNWDVSMKCASAYLSQLDPTDWPADLIARLQKEGWADSTEEAMALWRRTVQLRPR